MFDKNQLAIPALDSVAEVKQMVESFFNGLAATPNLPAPVKANLQQFSFEFTFAPRDSLAAERLAFGAMDFPVYLISTEDPSPFTPAEGEALLSAHSIPENTITKAPAKPLPIEPVKSYEAVATFIADRTDKLGIGVPGTYFILNTQSRCRKIGLVKVTQVVKGVNSFDVRKKRFAFVVNHEVSHMLGVGHQAGTLMDTNYDNGINSPNLTPEQIKVISDALTVIRHL